METAIVVIAYNRAHCLQKLLLSIENASYEGFRGTTLVISIDHGNNPEVKKIADTFQWPHGQKEIIFHEEHLGLREHVLRCGDLSYKYGSVIILEDDLLVSPYFYQYTAQALSFYKNDERIAGISLYNYHFNETAQREFVALDDGHDNYFAQIPSSSGQAFTSTQWSLFRNWMDSEEHLPIKNSLLPHNIINWPESSWKKYFSLYLVENNRFFVYPGTSLSTNTGEAGTHLKKFSKIHITPMLFPSCKKTYSFSTLETGFSIYDIYFEIHPEILKKFNPALSDFDFETDLYAQKDLSCVRKNYLLTSRPCSEKIFSFNSHFTPHEISILYDLNGEGFSLCKASDIIHDKQATTAQDEFFPFEALVKVKYNILVKTLLVKIVRRIKLAWLAVMTWKS